eukprot:Colp12_sorted_trinity150504_noHs@15723
MGCGGSKTPVASKVNIAAYKYSIAVRVEATDYQKLTLEVVNANLRAFFASQNHAYFVRHSLRPAVCMVDIYFDEEENDIGLEKRKIEAIASQLKSEVTISPIELSNSAKIVEVALPEEGLCFDSCLKRKKESWFEESLLDSLKKADSDKDGFVTIQEFWKGLLTQTLNLQLSDYEIQQIESKVTREIDVICIGTFIEEARDLITEAHNFATAAAPDSATEEWVQMWCISAGVYYFSKKDGSVQRGKPASFKLAKTKTATPIKQLRHVLRQQSNRVLDGSSKEDLTQSTQLEQQDDSGILGLATKEEIEAALSRAGHVKPIPA